MTDAMTPAAETGGRGRERRDALHHDATPLRRPALSRREIAPEQLELLPGAPADTGPDREEWISAALDAIAAAVAIRGTVTADDVRCDLAEPGSPAWWGAAFVAARKAGIIVPSGAARQSTALSRRHGVQLVWRAPRRRRRGGAA